MHTALQDLLRTAFTPDAGKQELERAFQICQHMLLDQSLPLDVRAGCYLVLSRGNDKPVECAEQAVLIYKKLHDDHATDQTLEAQFKALTEMAQNALDKAKQRIDTTATNSEGQKEEAAAEREPQS